MPERMTALQIDEAVAQLPGLQHAGADGLRIEVEAPSFSDGIGLVDAVARVAEEMDHHPDIDIRWTTVTFTLSTHSEGGVTALDVGLAARILELAAGWGHRAGAGGGRRVSDTRVVGPTGLPDEHHDNPQHHGEQHHGDVRERLNWLRAGVLGANDGIVSVAGIVIGVAGATADRGAILTAGTAGLVAGALSMAGGEYVSVSTQRDTQQALLRKERWELATMPEQELAELAELYRRRGLSAELAQAVAEQLTARDALAAHAEVELGFDPEVLLSPWRAAWASLVAFVAGALLPLLLVLAPRAVRVPVCVAAVVVALAVTGAAGAWLGSASPRRAVARNVAVGLLAMGVTYLVGTLVGGRL